MIDKEKLDLLRLAVTQEGSQAIVARKIGRSSATISLVLKGNYKGNTEAVLERIWEVYSDQKVRCPVLGEIVVGRCAEERRAPFSAGNSLRVRLFRACRSCSHNRKPA